MSTVALTDTYCVRPDIFVKISEERIYLRHQDRHYILRLGAELLGSVFRFLDGVDGRGPLRGVVALFPDAHRQALLKFLGFLVDKGAAFPLSDGPTPAELAPVGDTLTYLSEYVADPVGSYRRFATRRLLLVGGGYALTSAVKTLARLGARQLHVLNLPELGRYVFSNDDFAAAFDELTPWPEARLGFVPSLAALAGAEFDEVLHCHERITPGLCHEIAAFTPARQWFGLLTATTLFITDDPDDAFLLAGRSPDAEPQGTPGRPPAALPSPTGSLAGGATFALACFDLLTSVRPATAGTYQYYDLDAQGRQKTAPRCRLLPLAEVADTAAGIGPSLHRDWDELTAAPLFPLHDLKEETDPRSYIKLYSIGFRAANAHGITRGRLAAAGFDRQSCQRQMLLTLAANHGLWFSPNADAERSAYLEAAARLQRACTVAASLRPILHFDAGTATWPPLSPKEEYIAFCIGTAFGVRVQWADVETGDGEFPRCLAAQAGHALVFMPHAGGQLTDTDRQQLLFGLYTALWSAAGGSHHSVHDVFLPAAALPLEAGDAA